MSRQLGEFFEAVWCPLGIGDVGAEKRPATVELEVEIAEGGFGLGEELNAGVFPDFIEVFGAHGTHIPVVGLEDPMNALDAMQQPREGARVVVAAFGAEVLDLQRFRPRPARILPVRVEVGCNCGIANDVIHRLIYIPLTTPTKGQWYWRLPMMAAGMKILRFGRCLKVRLMVGVLVAAALGSGTLASSAQVATSGPEQTAPAAPANYSPGIRDVLKLADAKVDTDVIKTYVRNSTVAYNPSATEIIALKEHGLSGDVITALLQRGGELRAGAARSGQANAALAVQPEYPSAVAPYAATPAYGYGYDYANQPVYAPGYACDYPVYSYTYPGYGCAWYDCGWPWCWPSLYFGCSRYGCGFYYPYCYSGGSYYGYWGHNYYGHYGSYYAGHSGSHGWGQPYHSGGSRAYGYGGRPVSFTSHSGGMRSVGGFGGCPASFASTRVSFHGGGSFGGGHSMGRR